MVVICGCGRLRRRCSAQLQVLEGHEQMVYTVLFAERSCVPRLAAACVRSFMLMRACIPACVWESALCDDLARRPTQNTILSASQALIPPPIPDPSLYT